MGCGRHERVVENVAQELQKMVRLEELFLVSVDREGRAHSEHLLQLLRAPSLRKLTLRHLGDQPGLSSDKSLTIFLEQNKRIRILSLQFTNPHPDYLRSLLSSKSELQSLRLFSCSIYREHGKALAKLIRHRALEELALLDLDMDNCVAQELAMALQSPTSSVRMLVITSSLLQRMFGNHLQGLHVEELNIEIRRIDPALELFGELNTIHREIGKLTLMACPKRLEADQQNAVFEAIRDTTTREVHLDGLFHKSKTSTQLLAEALMASRNVRSLTLSIEMVHVEEFCRYLPRMRRLLHMGWKGVFPWTREVCQSMNHAVTQSSSLVRVDFELAPFMRYSQLNLDEMKRSCRRNIASMLILDYETPSSAWPSLLALLPLDSMYTLLTQRVDILSVRHCR